MDKVRALKKAIDEILEADQVSAVADDEYLVRDDTTLVRVRRRDGGDWVPCFESGLPIPYAPTHHRPHEVVAWVLQQSLLG